MGKKTTSNFKDIMQNAKELKERKAEKKKNKKVKERKMSLNGFITLDRQFNIPNRFIEPSASHYQQINLEEKEILKSADF